MKIKWKMSIAGTVYNRDGGVKPGDVMEVDDDEAQRVIALGQAEAVNQGRRSEEHAVEQFSNEERAVLSTEIIGAASTKVIPQSKAPEPPKVEVEAEVEPEPEPEPEPKPVYGETNPPKPGLVKRGPGRPRKA